MPANRKSPPEEKHKLIESPLKLRRPQSPGSGLMIAGAVVTLTVLLLWFLGSDRGPRPIQLSPQESAVAAAEQVEQLTKELSGRAVEVEKTATRVMAGGDDRTLTLNGVQFRMFVPEGWSISDGARQKFVRKTGDSRICQLTADNSYNTKGLIADIRGKEVDSEAQVTKEALGVAVPDEVRIEVTGKLILSNYSSTSVNYVVKIHTKMIIGNRVIEKSGINSMFAAGLLMVRLQCMNMSGTDDNDDQMEIIGKSLKLQMV